MKATSFLYNPEKGRLLPAQAAIYGLLTLTTLFALWPGAVATWRLIHPPGVPATGIAAPNSHPRETLAVEVGKQVAHWKQENFAWTLSAQVPSLRDVLPVDMASLDGVDLAHIRVVLAQGGTEVLPSLAGTYKRGRVAASDWPRPGSTAIELLPVQGTDPEIAVKPWRAVLMFSTSNEATGFARQAVADGRGVDEILSLGQVTTAIPAVPVDRTEVNGVTTFYVICPATATLAISGVRLMQMVEPATSAEAERHNKWQSLHDAFLSKERQKAQGATTDDEKRAIQTEIAAWKDANPEPPRPATSPTPPNAAPTR